MKEIPFFDMRRLTEPYASELKNACAEVIDSGLFLRSEQTAAFERELAEKIGTKYCVALSNGLDSLRLSLRAWILRGLLRRGDEVIVPGNTFVASVLAICDAGLTPVLVEPEPLTMNLDPSQVEKAITPATRAIMEVHLYGTPALHNLISEIARRHGLLIIEDNAQAIGASASGLKTGAMGDTAAFSFYPAKNIGALGDAGAITTNDGEQAEIVRNLANYGSPKRYHNIYRGYNCRMDEIQAAMLRVKLRHLDEVTEHRQRIAAIYDSLITNPKIMKPAIIEGTSQVWHQYVVRTSERDRLQQWLSERGIGTMIHYAIPSHLQPCFRELKHGPLPYTEQLAKEVLSLPIASVTESGAEYVAGLLNCF